MWDLMEKFGKHCGWGGDLPFDTVILIEDNDLKGEVETDKHKLLKECRQTGRTTATTEKVLKTVFSQMKEMENHKSPVEEAYKRFFGCYPHSGDRWNDENEILWYAFQVGYKSAKEDCKVEEEPKPPTLFEVLLNLGYSYDRCYEIVDAVKECLPDEHYSDGEDYDLGFNDCLKKIKDRLG
jgi:hypothetical protein